MEKIEKVEKFGQIEIIQDKKASEASDGASNDSLDNEILNDLKKMDRTHEDQLTNPDLISWKSLFSKQTRSEAQTPLVIKRQQIQGALFEGYTQLRRAPTNEEIMNELEEPSENKH